MSLIYNEDGTVIKKRLYLVEMSGYALVVADSENDAFNFCEWEITKLAADGCITSDSSTIITKVSYPHGAITEFHPYIEGGQDDRLHSYSAIQWYEHTIEVEELDKHNKEFASRQLPLQLPEQ